MPAGYSFRPRVWVLALSAGGCVAFIALGQWQAHRAQEKRELGVRVERIVVHGHFAPRHTVYLDNKLRQGRAGYEVVTPLSLSGGAIHVLVNRGWVAAPPARERLPEVRTPAGPVRVEGVLKDRLPQALEIGKPPAGKVRQNLDVAGYARETGLRIEPMVIEQHSALDDGLLREWPRADAGVERHESYSLQWYSLAVLAAALGVVFSFRRVAAN